MSNRHTLLKGSSVLLIALATGCATTLPGTNTNIASGPSLNGSGLIANNAGGLISNNAGGLISNNAGGLISNNAGGLISNNAGGLISNNAGGLISNNAGGLTGTASGPAAGLISNNAGGLISNNAGGLISNNAGGLISNNAGGLISNNAGGYRVVLDAESSPTQPIAGARCAVFNERGEQVSYSWTTTDANGHYSFSRLKPSGPVLFVKIVYEAEGQEVTLMATTPAPRKAGNVTADVSPATTLVAKKVEEMVRLRAVNVASVQQSTVNQMVQTLAPALTPKGIVAAAILPDDSVAKTFDAMLTAAPAVSKALNTVVSSAGLTTLVETTPAQIQPNVPAVITPPANNGGGNTSTDNTNPDNGGGNNPTPTPTPTQTTGDGTTPTGPSATVFNLASSVTSGSALAANGSALYAPNGTSTDLANVASLTSAASFAADSATPAGARAVAFDGGVEYALVGSSIVGGGNTVTDPSLANATSFVVVNGAAYATDATDNCLLKADLAGGTVSTFAGTANRNGGAADGTGAAASFKGPRGITYANGNLYVADTNNSEIRQVTLAGGAVTTLAGDYTITPGLADGKGSKAHFDVPRGIAADAAGNLYVADTGNQAIRKLDAAGNVSTFTLSSSVTLPASIAAGTVNGASVLFVGTLGNSVDVLSGF
ncbi:MAG TPA: hypothetical protein V6D47_11165 [Oscillatoriaceae cyanobacterium]